MFDFNLDDVLEAPTVVRSEFSESQTEVKEDFSDLEFEEEIDLDEEEEPTAEIELPYDPKENAEILVELIDTFNTAALTPLAVWKLKKNRGGKTAIRRMQEIAEKHFSGEELTAKEKRMLHQYNSYLKDKEELEGSIPYTDEERARLIKCAIPYMKKAKIRIGGGMAFWTELSLIQGTRIIQVLTA